jgi:hypothetical protein
VYVQLDRTQRKLTLQRAGNCGVLFVARHSLMLLAQFHKNMNSSTVVFVRLFSLALRPNAGHALLIFEIS